MKIKIDQQSLNKKLLEIGKDLDNRLFKTAQTAINFDALNSLKSKLVDSLYNKVSTKTQNPNSVNISTKLDTDVNLTGIPLENLGALVRFLTTNQITVNNERISYNSNEESSVPNKDTYKFYTLRGNAGLLEQTTRQPQQFGYFINLDLLKKYLTDLYKTSTNRIQKVMVEKLLTQANSDLDINVSTKPEQNLQQVLDSLPEVLDLKNPTTPGNKVLTLNDISSDTNFNNWMQKSPSAAYTLNNKRFDYSTRDFNICAYIKAVYDRARFLYSRAPTFEQKELYKTYVSMVASTARSLTDNNGNSCNLSVDYSAAGNAGDYKNVGYKEEDAESNNNSGTSKIDRDRLFTNLPLLNDRIDFARIRDFLTNVKPFINNSNIANETQNMLQTIEHYFNNSEGVNLRSNVDEFATKIIAKLNLTGNQKSTAQDKLKISQYLYSYIDYLKALVINVGETLDSLKNHSSNMVPAEEKALNEQAGNMTASKLSQNLNTLDNWKDNLPRILGTIK